MRPSVRSVGIVLLVAAVAHPAGAQESAGDLRIEREDRSVEPVSVTTERGHAGVPLSEFRELGWLAEERDGHLVLSAGTHAEVRLQLGSAFLRWNERPLQLVNAPYRDGGETFIPLQVLTEFLPERLPEYYDYDPEAGILRAGVPDASGTPASPERPAPEEASSRPSTTTEDPEPGPVPERAYDGVRIVWIDAGHGGADPGAIGRGGIREKDVALGIARKVADRLSEASDIEVRMTRDDDGFVDLWQRGLLATEAKGERPGVFVSIHANSFAARRTTRGFETYFLSEARTEDERRVSAIENAPLSIRGRGVDVSRQSDLDFILRELRNFDHQHWSALLAELIQDELDRFHPGPNRGVKQGPFAVLTNALMPSVLVEVGFLTNEDEARLLARDDFQDRAATGIASAVERFLERYPPGDNRGGSR